VGATTTTNVGATTTTKVGATNTKVGDPPPKKNGKKKNKLPIEFVAITLKKINYP